MSRVLTALHHHAAQYPHRIALHSGTEQLSYQQLATAVNNLAAELSDADVRVLALAADNSTAWVIADLACISATIPLIPVPYFFSPQQIAHLLHSAGVDALLSDKPDAVHALLKAVDIDEAGKQLTMSVPLTMIRVSTAHVPLPADCAKITFTSGSTGEPKGVCLSQPVMETVAESLAAATGAVAEDRHISLLPYATLLENIGGLYAPLLSGATVVVAGMAAVGMRGASGLDIGLFVSALNQHQASTCIMIPQMLHALITALEQGMPRPHTLRYIAVGGAPVSAQLLQRAAALELPVYEGYGLSEAASVVAVNRPDDCKAGSVGRPLPHVDLKFASDGEILVRGALFSGYLGDTANPAGEYWPTGDIGHLDDAGFLYLSGRKKHIFITAFGRNVSPEWVERELSIEPAIAQCCVFGEARPFNVAVIVGRELADGQGATADAIQQAVDAANARLPDYARVARWLLADEAFSVSNALWTGTGRPRREHIYRAYTEQMNHLYKES